MKRHIGLIVFLFCAAAAPPTIEWDQKSLRLVAEHADYPRMARLSPSPLQGEGRGEGRSAPAGPLALAYDRHRKMYFRTSSDEGKTWSEELLIAQDPDCWLTNAALLVKKNGTILYLWNERPRLAVRHEHDKNPPPLVRPFLIRISKSTDNGKTWSSPETLFTGGTTFHDGCWEPAAIELPTGELHIYFSNETPFKNSPEQEITRLLSTDSGTTWHTDGQVSFRPNHRDGMPSPLLLTDGTIVLAIEDNGINGNIFKPTIVRIGPKPERWSALKDPLPPTTYGGAPFLARLPSGHTILSYQESEDGQLDHCRLAVCIGDENAKDFANKTYPLPESDEGNQAWNSLFVKNEKTVTALSTATLQGKRGIWLIDGQLRFPHN